MAAHNETYVSLLEKLCVYEKLAEPVYTYIPHTPEILIRVRAESGFFSIVANAATMKEAREMAAEHLYEYLQMLPSIHSIPGILRQAASRVPPGMDRTLYINKLKKRSWQRRQKQQIKNTSEIYENHAGLMTLFEEHKRISAMEELNSDAKPEVLVARAAKKLGLKKKWKIKSSKWCRLPLVSLGLKHTSPKLKFLGYDRNDAAMNCVNYLKLTLLEAKKVPDLLKLK